MAIENVQQLLTEQMGKNRCDVILTDNMTSKDYYCIHFPITSVILSIATNISFSDFISLGLIIHINISYVSYINI